MFKDRFKISIILSVIIVVVAITASAGGLFIGDLYRDNASIKAAWYGNDLVTLFVAVPLMVISLLLSMRGSQRAQLIWMGTLWYMVYNYIFYLYAAAFNKFFLLYVVLFTLSTYALIFAMMNADPKEISRKFNLRTPVKWISGYMLFFAALLGVLWIASSLSFIITGEVPQDIIKTGHPTGVVYATDLSLLVPALVLSAILLWRRQPWGYALSAIVLIKSITYSLVLIVMSMVAYIRVGLGDAFLPLWVFLSTSCLIFSWLLLGNMKSNNKSEP